MRVLVVEDVRSLADDIAEGLRDNGFAVDVAYDGLDASAKLDTNGYQVVVLDRDLPGIHGDVLCRMITEADRPVMVLMLTAADTAEEHRDEPQQREHHSHDEQPVDREPDAEGDQGQNREQHE